MADKKSWVGAGAQDHKNGTDIKIQELLFVLLYYLYGVGKSSTGLYGWG